MILLLNNYILKKLIKKTDASRIGLSNSTYQENLASDNLENSSTGQVVCYEKLQKNV